MDPSGYDDQSDPGHLAKGQRHHMNSGSSAISSNSARSHLSSSPSSQQQQALTRRPGHGGPGTSSSSASATSIPSAASSYHHRTGSTNMMAHQPHGVSAIGPNKTVPAPAASNHGPGSQQQHLPYSRPQHQHLSMPDESQVTSPASPSHQFQQNQQSAPIQNDQYASYPQQQQQSQSYSQYPQQSSSSVSSQVVVSMESPLPPVVQRSLGDRSTEKRKNAALEIEALIKSLQEANNLGMIQSVIAVLSKDFCTSMNSNYRKGGLVGLAATAIGLGTISAHQFLSQLLPPVLHCFDDPESRVRYYACESLYNIAKVSRQAVLDHYFSHIWEGLTKLFADVDIDVKNGANLLDRLIKDIVTEADNFHVDQFLPLLQTYIRRTNPFIRQLIVGWITFLDSIPDISMLDYLPDFLDGLFNMLSDSNREIRQAADSALAEFLRELASSTVVELGPVVSILVAQCQNPKEPLNRLTAMKWLAEIIHHPYSGGDAILPFHAQILSAILFCISDFGEQDIRQVAERTNDVMLGIVRKTTATFELPRLLETLSSELLNKDDVPTKMACLRWINMLMEKRKSDMHAFTEKLLPVLLRTLSDPSDAVVLLDLQALSRISTSKEHDDNDKGDDGGKIRKGGDNQDTSSAEDPEEEQFQVVLHAILNLFAHDRQLLETRGSLVIRKLCVLLNAKKVYIGMADTLSSYGEENGGAENAIKFISTMVQTLSIILLTASELHELRTTLAQSFQEESEEGRKVFVTLFHCWCHNPVSTFSLCLLARAFDLSFALVKRFSEMRDISVGFLMQIDKLVQLLESPIFIHLRLQLLDVESPHHAALLKSIYGLLMCLPQGDAFRLLNDRLTTVCNLRDNLGVSGGSGGTLDLRRGSKLDGSGSNQDTVNIVGKTGLSLERLLERFDDIMKQHEDAKMRELSFEAQATDETIIPLRSGMTNDHHLGVGAGGKEASPSRARTNLRGDVGSGTNITMSPHSGGVMSSGGTPSGVASHQRTHSSSSYQSNSNHSGSAGGRNNNHQLPPQSHQQQYQQNQPYHHRHQQNRYQQQNNMHDERSPRPHARTRISQ